MALRGFPRIPGSRLVRWLLVTQVVTVLVTLVIAGGVGAWNTSELVEDDTGERVLGVAQALSVAPGTAQAVAARDSATLQPVAAGLLRGADVSFVTVMDPAGTRLTHPDPARIGGTYRGTFAPAAAGGVVVETFGGTLGPSVRAVVPVREGPGQGTGPVVGMVAVGVLTVDVAGDVSRQWSVLAVGALAAAALGVALAAFAARRVRRDTLGLDPSEITALHRHHDAVLHAMREGLLVVDDTTGRVVVLNDEAVRLLDVPAAVAARVGRARRRRDPGPTLATLGLDDALRDRLDDPAPITDESHLVGERILLLNRTRADPGATPSSVITLRDRTEIDGMLRALDDARTTAGALRFQAHEHANRLQAVSTLIELGAHEDARELAVRWGREVVGLGEEARTRIGHPALAALLIDKAVDARDRSLELHLGEATSWHPVEVPADLGDDLVTVVGNLVDNALDAVGAAGRAGRVEVEVRDGTDRSVVVRVSDDGPGLPDPDAVFTVGWSTKNGATADSGGVTRRGLGLALVQRVVARRGGTLTAGPGPEGTGTTFTVTLPVTP